MNIFGIHCRSRAGATHPLYAVVCSTTNSKAREAKLSISNIRGALPNECDANSFGGNCVGHAAPFPLLPETRIQTKNY